MRSDTPTRPNTAMPISHHSHSGEFCKHATGSLTDSVAAAIARKFHTYGLSEHVPRYRLQDLYPEEIQASMSLHHLASQFDGFVAKAHVLKSAYADQIVLLVGLETEYITDLDLDRLDSLLHRLGDKIQYIVGSVHHVNAIPIDFDIQTHQKAIDSFANGGGADEDQARGAFLESYFDAQYELMQRFQPEIIGHVDLCRLYTPELRFADYPRALEKLRRNIKFAVDYGALFEVNAAAFRKNWKTAYPGRDVLEASAFLFRRG